MSDINSLLHQQPISYPQGHFLKDVVKYNNYKT